MNMTEVGLLCSVAVNFVSLYASVRATRTKARKEDAEADDQIETSALAKWQTIAAKLEAKIDHQDKLIDAMRLRELACVEQAARQGERIEHLTADLKQLRTEMRRAGIKTGTGDHEPLKDPTP
ncbi:MAG TPA: hypothetical protein VGE74_03055 [Gemmata sp.]